MFKSKSKSLWPMVSFSVFSIGIWVNANADTTIPTYIYNNSGSKIEIAYQFCTAQLECGSMKLSPSPLPTGLTQINVPSPYTILNVYAATMANNDSIATQWNHTCDTHTDNSNISIVYDLQSTEFRCLTSDL